MTRGRFPALRVAALVLGLVAPSALWAQALPLRSGEHATFTRLTLPLPAGSGWQLGRIDGGYGLRLDREDQRIDASIVFTRIPRTRLASLDVRPGAVDFALACDCHLNAFVEGGLLVMDIRNGPPPPGARFETRLGGPVAAAPAVRPGFDWTRQLVSPLEPLEPLALPPSVFSTPTLGPAIEAAARDLLLRQFARAAAQGLIATDLAGLTQPRPVVVADPPPPALQPEQPQAELDPLRNLRIDAETAMDRAQRTLLRPSMMPDGSPCLPDATFDLAAWGDERPAGDQIAARRAALVGEFDAPDPKAVAALARLYLHLGFGAEALAVLDAFPVAVPDGAVLRDLARLVDEALPLPQSQLAGMAACDGAVALWAVLAASGPRPDPATDREAVRRAFSALPLWLRRHLGPTLVQRFVALGDMETVQQLRNAIGRAPGDHGPALDLIDAEIALARGQPEEASRALAPAAAGNTPSAPEALATMVEARLAAGLPIDAATADNVVALAFEHRGTPLGLRFGRLEALGLGAAGRFDAAFGVRDRLGRDAPAPALQALGEELMAMLVAEADTETFLSRAFTETFWHGGTLASDHRKALAERLLAEGFPDAALLALRPGDAAVPDERTLQARAALALNDPRGALRSIAGETGTDAARLRGAALEMLGEHDAARLAFGDAGMDSAAARAAWLGGDWATVARLGQGTTAQLAASLAAATLPPAPMRETADPDGAEQGPPMVAPEAVAAAAEGELATARARLAEAAEARALLGALLSEHAVDTER